MLYPASTVPQRARRARKRPRLSWGLVAPLLTCGLLLAPRAADAAPRCSVNAGGGLAFGIYDTFAGAALDSQLSVQVHCPRGLVPRLLLDAGSAPSFAPRTLRNGTEILEYNVYLNAAHTLIWGDGTSGTSVWDGPTGNTTLRAFGRIPPGQDVAVGIYADALVLTVLF